ncbi:MAG: hypothetical protein JNN01_18935 [Opitutaceae bacterium]|nr:hypothetical protein [Opitutaceae bacterium]
MRLPLPILEDGILQPTGAAGRVGEKSLKLSFDLPTPLDPNRSTVEVQLAPGVATSVLGALPFLIEYPHGCVEQTMNRFLPAAVAAAWFRDLGLDSKAIDDVLLGKQGTSSWGSQPVTPRLSLDALIQQGLSRLSSAQLHRGGFGWWSQGDPDAFMTGLVLRGLSVAAKTGISVPPSLTTGTRRAVLESLQFEGHAAGEMDRVWLLSAVLIAGPLSEQERKTLTGIYENLHLTREKLPPAGLALLLQCAHHLARATEVPELVRRLETTAQRNRSRELGELVHWGQSERHFRALEGMIESTALCLEALLLVDSKHPLVDPAAAALLINRQSNRWSNTRDTAYAAIALLAYARSRGDASADASFRISINGRTLETATLTRDSMLAVHRVRVPVSLLQSGRNTLLVTRLKGDSPGYATVTAQSWARADSLRSSGDFLQVSRTYLRLAERTGLTDKAASAPEVLTPISAALAQNERVECRVRIQVPQELHYVMLDCPKPGGCEPINSLSGWDASLQAVAPPGMPPRPASREGINRSVYREEHPDRSVFFLHRLPAGTWELRYTLRATFAGDYRALPVTAQAMYAPVVSANTDARRLVIQPVAGAQR